MSNQVFQQNLGDKKGPQPGGPYLIQMLFKEPVPMPDKETMTTVMEKHIGSVECFCYDKQMAGFAAQEHIAEFKAVSYTHLKTTIKSPIWQIALRNLSVDWSMNPSMIRMKM